MGLLSERFNLDLSAYPPDGPFPMADIMATLEDRPNIGGERSRFLADIREDDTIASYSRRMAARTYSAHQYKAGDPEQIADHMEQWMEAGACDGFMISFVALPSTLSDFVEKVVPELQRRGVFRQDYQGRTLREHLGLSRPEFAEAYGISFRTLEGWEQGLRTPDRFAAAVICASSSISSSLTSICPAWTASSW